VGVKELWQMTSLFSINAPAKSAVATGISSTVSFALLVGAPLWRDSEAFHAIGDLFLAVFAASPVAKDHWIFDLSLLILLLCLGSEAWAFPDYSISHQRRLVMDATTLFLFQLLILLDRDGLGIDGGLGLVFGGALEGYL